MPISKKMNQIKLPLIARSVTLDSKVIKRNIIPNLPYSKSEIKSFLIFLKAELITPFRLDY